MVVHPVHHQHHPFCHHDHLRYCRHENEHHEPGDRVLGAAWTHLPNSHLREPPRHLGSQVSIIDSSLGIISVRYQSSPGIIIVRYYHDCHCGHQASIMHSNVSNISPSSYLPSGIVHIIIIMITPQKPKNQSSSQTLSLSRARHHQANKFTLRRNLIVAT